MIRLKNHRRGGVVRAFKSRDAFRVLRFLVVATLVLSVLGWIGEQDRITQQIEWGCAK